MSKPQYKLEPTDGTLIRVLMRDPGRGLIGWTLHHRATPERAVRFMYNFAWN